MKHFGDGAGPDHLWDCYTLTVFEERPWHNKQNIRVMYKGGYMEPKRVAVIQAPAVIQDRGDVWQKLTTLPLLIEMLHSRC